MPISRKENSVIERCISENGANAVTHYEVLAENKSLNYSVLKCFLETGRTHQIRVHMAAISHPLLGDTLYGNSSNFINRQALHSYMVSFKEPSTNETVCYKAPLPEDMKSILESLNFIL